MSLINQMLKDLEQRRGKGSEDNTSSTDALQPVLGKPKSYGYRKILWPLIGVLVVIILLYVWLKPSPPVPKPVMKKPVVTVSTQPAPVIITAPEPMPVVAAPAATVASKPIKPMAVTPKPVTVTPVTAVVAKQPQPLTPAQKAAQAYQVVMNEYQAGQTQQAIQDLQVLVQQFPQYSDARIALVKYQLQNQRYSQASVLLEQGLQQNPTDPTLLTLKAQMLDLQGNPQQALLLLQQQSPAIKNNTDYYALQASVLRQLGSNVAASELYNQLLAVDSSRAEWWLGLGLTLEAQGRNGAAVSAYQHVLSNPGVSPDVRLFVTDKLRQLGG